MIRTSPGHSRIAMIVFFATALATYGNAGHAQAVGNAALGKAQYEATCGGCHSLDANRVGPLHRGVVGREIASVADYAYSPAIKRLRGVWTTAKLDTWLQGPQRVAPGTKMVLSVQDADRRANIIAYLSSVSVPPVAKAGH